MVMIRRTFGGQRPELMPIPPGWEKMPDDELENLLSASTVISTA